MMQYASAWCLWHHHHSHPSSHLLSDAGDVRLELIARGVLLKVDLHELHFRAGQHVRHGPVHGQGAVPAKRVHQRRAEEVRRVKKCTER